MITTEEARFLDNLKRQVYSCSKCHGSDYNCSCWLNYRVHYSALKAKIPLQYLATKRTDITHPQIQTQKKIIEDYIQDLATAKAQGNCLYLYGQEGLAKSYLATQILIEALLKNYTARYFSSPLNLIEAVYQSWNNTDFATDFEHAIVNSDFIAIDCIMPNNTVNDKVATYLTTLFLNRANNLRPTIFISNYPRIELLGLEAKLVSLFQSRMTELKFAGVSYKEIVRRAKKRA